MAEFVLHVQDLDEAGKDYAFELSHAWLDAHLADATLRHDPAFGPGKLQVHAQENGGEYLVTGTLNVHVLTECGRCLGEAKLAVDTVIGTLFARAPGKPSGAPHAGQARRAQAERYERHADEDEEDEVPREEFSGNDIVLDDLVREHIVLEVPMQPLCSEACTGIAIPTHLQPPADVFPGSAAVDPRLAPLQRLRDNVPPMSPAPSKTPKPKSKPKSNKE
ncbi:MAG TPA: DUF177 domain-containing protein [Polyangiales bacterium]|nr:DUF177 domain-containing protein [Polyangiales bacterium]